MELEQYAFGGKPISELTLEEARKAIIELFDQLEQAEEIIKAIKLATDTSYQAYEQKVGFFEDPVAALLEGPGLPAT